MNIRRSLMVVIWGFLGVGLFLLALAPGMGASPAEHAMRQAVADPYGSITVCPGGACDYTTIQAAVDAASEGDTIKVAQGVYTSPAFQVVHITKEITVTGGYTTTDWANPHPLTQTTVLDAEGVARRRGVYIDGTGVPTITLSGLTIQRGHARGEGGGGVFVVTGTVVIQGSQVLSNTVRDYYLAGEVDYPIGGAMPHPVGGGVYMARGALILSHNSIQGNSADGGGGGAYLGYVVASLTGNTFLSNTVPVSDEVGVLSMSAYSVPRGGGIFISSATRSASLTHNVFRGNSALYGGGGAYVGEIY